MNEGKSCEQIWIEYNILFNNDLFFKSFRSHISKNNLGFGEDAFCILWEKLISGLNKDFSFLEIGVYKGQTLCLIGYLSKKYNLNSEIFGVTPLEPVGDKTTDYDDSDYSKDIINLHKKFAIPFNLDKQIIKGLSTDENVKKIISNQKFDIIYIDGGHDYETVESDIKLAKTICKDKGYIITDDSSCFKKFDMYRFIIQWFKNLSINLNKNFFPFFKGHYEVSLAVKDFLENDASFIEKYCVGHLRVFQKK